MTTAPRTSNTSAANPGLAVRGVWFRHAIAIIVFLPLVYWLLRGFAVGPLNEALGVEE